MGKNMVLTQALLVAVLGVFMYGADAQETRLSTFQELAQIITEPAATGNVTASVTLQSTSNQEIRIPSGLEEKILENGRILAVVVTNEESCVLGVSGESCILVNVRRGADWEGITETQNETRAIGEMLIDDINSAFDTDARYHSVFLHHSDGPGTLGTTGAISGRNTVSAVFTMPMESTDSMYEKISALLLSKRIRESGGFYDVARNLSQDKGATMIFSIIPQGANLLYQLRVSVSHPDADLDSGIRPLEFLGTNSIQRSGYFDGGSYPLNSLIQVVLIGDNRTLWTSPGDIDSENSNGTLVPTDLGQTGWIQNQDSGRIKGMVFLFGERTSVDSGELLISFSPVPEKVPGITDESMIIVGVIAAGAIGAAVFFLKGYKKP